MCWYRKCCSVCRIGTETRIKNWKQNCSFGMIPKFAATLQSSTVFFRIPIQNKSLNMAKIFAYLALDKSTQLVLWYVWFCHYQCVGMACSVHTVSSQNYLLRKDQLQGIDGPIRLTERNGIRINENLEDVHNGGNN